MTMNGAIMGIKVLYVLDMVGSCRLFLYMQMKAYSSVVYWKHLLKAYLRFRDNNWVKIFCFIESLVKTSLLNYQLFQKFKLVGYGPTIYVNLTPFLIRDSVLAHEETN